MPTAAAPKSPATAEAPVATGRPRPHRRAAAAEAIGFYLALLIPTLLFKYIYIGTLTAGDMSLLQPAGAGADGPSGWLLAKSVFPADLIETLLLAEGALLVGHNLLGIPPLRLALFATALLLAAGGAELLALDELGTLLTADTLRAALGWGLGSLSVVPSFLTPRRIALVLVGAAWLLVPVAVAAIQRRLARVSRIAGLAIPLALLALVLFAIVRVPETFAPRAGTSPFARGFWRSAALALSRPDTAPAPNVAAGPGAAQVLDAYRQLAYPEAAQPTSPQPWVMDVPASLRSPRHIVIVSLETAPHAYYDLDNPDLPAFRTLRAHALVADEHRTSAPMSSAALFSIVSGTYPRPGAPLVRYGDFASDSLAAALEPRGYETTYVDSYDIEWNGAEDARTLHALGFDLIRDARTERVQAQPGTYARRLAQDRRSLELARERVVDAARRDRHALVVAVTHLGHFDWPSAPGDPPRSGREALSALTRAIDGLVGEFLAGIDAAGLTDDLILVVTGDHGLRFRAEFESLDEPLTYGDATFHVPLVIYAPALFATERRIAHVTSHADLAPTLLDLTGTPRDDALHHGDNLLDPRVARRITFLPSGVYPGLRPVDGFHWNGVFYAWHEVADRVTFRRRGERGEQPLTEGSGNADLGADQVRDRLRRSRQIFNDTAAVFLRRATTTDAGS